MLIVAGVLTALALETWNSDRKERQLELEYLAALAEDAHAHVRHYDGWLAGLARHEQWTTAIWGWANGATPAADQSVEEVLLWVRLGGQLNLNTRTQNGAWQDLVNSGRLGLIRDRALRERLVEYHNSAARWHALIETNGANAAQRYGAASAGVIPADVAWLANAGHELSVDPAPILAAFRQRDEVRHALVELSQSHRFRVGAAARLRQQAAELLERLDDELARRGGPRTAAMARSEIEES